MGGKSLAQPYELLLYATDLPKEVKAPRAWLQGWAEVSIGNLLIG
jgi:hypothetical protein